MMRKTIWSAAILLLAVLGSHADSDRPADKANEKVHVFVGEIADSQCSMNVHSLTRSHEEMLKRKSMGGTSRNCTLYCIQYLGGELVLSSKENVFRLDNQERVHDYAGQKVKITGTLEPKTKTIRVEKIDALVE